MLHAGWRRGRMSFWRRSDSCSIRLQSRSRDCWCGSSVQEGKTKNHDEPREAHPARLARAHPRERLFSKLDVARECPVVWVASPPGAGKTTLVVSYLDARKLSTTRKRPGEADPATFFHYLGKALGTRRPRCHALPRSISAISRAHAAFLPRILRTTGSSRDCCPRQLPGSPRGQPAARDRPRCSGGAAQDINLLIVSRGESRRIRTPACTHPGRPRLERSRLTLANEPSEAARRAGMRGRPVARAGGGLGGGADLLLESDGSNVRLRG